MKEVWLAPMAGITDAPFRKVVCDFGVSAVISEMVSSEAITRRNEKTFKRLIKSAPNYKKIIQLVGCNPETMVRSAQISRDCGADEININMGCPAKKIINTSSGSALMLNEDLAVKIAESIVESVSIPVSVKMRLGWDDAHRNAAQLSKKLEAVGVSLIAVHGRTRAQEYSEHADWKAIGEVKHSVSIPVLCNGDINTLQDAEQALRESECDGLMIGRGALGRPWFISQVMQYINNETVPDEPSISEQLDIVMNHFDMVLQFYGEEAGIRIFRKHFCCYSKGMKNATDFRSEVNLLENPDQIRRVVSSFYDAQ